MKLNTWNDYQYFTFLNHFIHFRHSNLPTINILVILFLEQIIASCSELILLHSYVIAPYSFSTQFRMHIKTCQNDYISIALRFFDQPSVIFLAFSNVKHLSNVCDVVLWYQNCCAFVYSLWYNISTFKLCKSYWDFVINSDR